MYTYFVFPITLGNKALIDNISSILPNVNSEQRSILLCSNDNSIPKIGNWNFDNQYFCCVWLLESEITDFNNIGFSDVSQYATSQEVYIDFKTIFTA